MAQARMLLLTANAEEGPEEGGGCRCRCCCRRHRRHRHPRRSRLRPRRAPWLASGGDPCRCGFCRIYPDLPGQPRRRRRARRLCRHHHHHHHARRSRRRPCLRVGVRTSAVLPPVAGPPLSPSSSVGSAARSRSVSPANLFSPEASPARVCLPPPREAASGLEPVRKQQ